MNNPIEIFATWFAEAKNTPAITEATAMILATASKEGLPSARVMLLKGFDERGFTFFTNFESRKSNEIKDNPHAALCFAWLPIGKQVRIEGKIEQVSDAEADEYYASRPLISRIGAWASSQSRPLDSREILMQKVEELKKIYSEQNPPPRPPHWSGRRVIPNRIEFWQEGEFRLHDRNVYTRETPTSNWQVGKLYP